MCVFFYINLTAYWFLAQPYRCEQECFNTTKVNFSNFLPSNAVQSTLYIAVGVYMAAMFIIVIVIMIIVSVINNRFLHHMSWII